MIRGCLLVFVGVLAFVTLVNILKPSRRDEPPAAVEPPKPKTPQAEASVLYDGRGSFGIANRNDFDLLECSVSLNPGFMDDGYSTFVKRIPKRKPVIIAASSFKKRNGVRYSEFREQPQYMLLRCDNDIRIFESVRASRN